MIPKELIIQKIKLLYYGCRVEVSKQTRDKDGRLLTKGQRIDSNLVDFDTFLSATKLCLKPEVDPNSSFNYLLEKIDTNTLILIGSTTVPNAPIGRDRMVTLRYIGVSTLMLPVMSAKTADILRANSYHVPYMGYDAFELDIAVPYYKKG